MIDIGSEDKFLAVRGDYISGEAFSIQHHVFVEVIFRAEGACFCEDVPGGWIGGLNFGESSIFAEDRQRFEEDWVIGSGGPIGEVLAHEIGAEEVGPVAAGSVTLGN